MCSEHWRIEPDIGPPGHFTGRTKPRPSMYPPGVPILPLSAIPAALQGAAKASIPSYVRSDKFLPSHRKPIDSLTLKRKVKTPRPSTADVPLRQQQKIIEKIERDKKRGIETAPPVRGRRPKPKASELDGLGPRYVREGHGSRMVLPGKSHNANIKMRGATCKPFRVVSYSLLPQFKTEKE